MSGAPRRLLLLRRITSPQQFGANSTFSARPSAVQTGVYCSLPQRWACANSHVMRERAFAVALCLACGSQTAVPSAEVAPSSSSPESDIAAPNSSTSTPTAAPAADGDPASSVGGLLPSNGT